jgi:hypothetical protein
MRFEGSDGVSGVPFQWAGPGCIRLALCDQRFTKIGVPPADWRLPLSALSARLSLGFGLGE